MRHLFERPEQFFSALKQRFLLPLPGEDAQNRMTSRARIPTKKYIEQHPDHRTSAVLLPLYPHDGVVYTALIRRTSYEGVHSGQLALPGGKTEKEDASLFHTALRETQEEVGVKAKEEWLLGPMTTFYIPVSNYLVHPFAVQLDMRPEWKPDPSEVAEVLEVPLTRLFDPAIKDRKKIPVGNNMTIEAPCYNIDGQILWGATAMIFSELEALVEELK